jgi:hypothetical protein
MVQSIAVRSILTGTEYSEMEMPTDADPQSLAIYGPYVFVPLYGFTSDTDILDLSEGLRICKYEKEKLELLLEHFDHLKHYLGIYPTTHLLEVRLPERGFFNEATRDNEKFRITIDYQAALKFLEPAHNLLSALRLFKPGSFCRGPVWYCCRVFELEGQRMLDEVTLPMSPAEGAEPISPGTGDAVSYDFELAELAPFKGFNTEFSAAIERLAAFPKVRLALNYFNASFARKPRENQVIDLFICLEALLLREEDELTFRLATRGANLLGPDANDRKRVFAEVKDFYNLRSKIVHGGVLKTREIQAAQNVDRLRELVRRALLCSVALALELGLEGGFFKALDETNLDDSLRMDIQRKTSRFLYRHGA